MPSDDVIERYLVELDAELRLPGRTRRRIVAEARDHLHELAANARLDGDASGQAHAVSAFGAPGVVAQRFAYELAIGATRRAARRGAVMFVLSLVLWELCTSSFIHVAPGWVNDGPGSAGLWIIGQVGLVAGVLSLVRARVARRAQGADTVRLRYVVRGLIVLAACTTITVGIAAAGVITAITTSADLRSVALLTAVTFLCIAVTTVTVSTVWQARRRLAALDDTRMTATGREALLDVRASAHDGLAWTARRLGFTGARTGTIATPSKPPPAPGALRRFDPCEYPWRFALLIALLAGCAVPVLDLVVIGLKGELTAPQLSQLASAALPMIAIESTLVLAGYASLGRYLGVRPTRTPSADSPA